MNYNDSDISRFLKALRREKGDRVPNWETQIDPGMLSYVLGRKIECSSISSKLEAPDFVNLARAIGLDAIGLGVGYSPGRIYKKDDLGNLHYVGGSLKTRGDFEREFRENPPDFEAIFARLSEYQNATKGSNLGVWAYVHGPLVPVYLGMGLEHFSLMLYDDLPCIEYLMDYFLEMQTLLVRRLAKIGVSFILVADDVAMKNGLMMNPGLFQKIYPPRLRKLIAPAKEKEVPLIYHSDGGIDQLAEMAIESGFSALHPIEPYSNDIYEVKRKFGDRITLCGNIELTGKSPKEVADDTRRHLDLLADGAYIMTSSHSLTDEVPPENYEAMLETLHRFGRYD